MNITDIKAAAAVMSTDGGGLWRMVIAGKAMINFVVDVGTQVRMKIPAAI